MQGKGTVKNPLTVIAIFAGTAEISGTAVLPLLETNSQSVYIWFLMLFPFTLIALFFITLNWNHRVLYAPSDFKDEDNFINILQKATVKEKLEKAEEELSDIDGENVETEGGDDYSPPSSVDEKSATTSDEIETPLAGTGASFGPANLTQAYISMLQNDDQNYLPKSKEDRALQSEILRFAHRSLRNDARLAEKLVLEKLENELDIEIETDRKFEFGHRRYVLDGVIRKGNNLTAIEVRFIRDMKIGLGSILYKSLDQLKSLYLNLSEAQQKEFSLIFAIVTDKIDERQLASINAQIERLGFPAVVKVYDFESLTSELMQNSS